MVRRLVEDEEVRLCDEHISQCHTLLLTTAELFHRLLEVIDMQLCENLLGFQYPLRIAMMIEAGVEHRLLGIELRSPLQITDANIIVKNNGTTVVALLSGNDLQERGLSRTVLGDESNLLTLSH